MSKYIVTRVDGGEFLPGEPLFVVRARDIASVSALTGYIDRLPDSEHRTACNRVLQDFWKWRANNAEHLVLPWDKESKENE